MVDLVLHRLCEQAVGLEFERLAVAIERAQLQLVVALNLVDAAGHRQATLFHLDAFGGIEDFRSDADDRLRPALVFAATRSEGHTSELPSLMHHPIAVSY